MDNTNIDWTAMSDKAIIAAIGEYLKQQRLIKNKTQAQIAVDAGINRWTLSKIENGEPVSLLLLIQILRALNLLDLLNIFQIKQQISPIELAKLEQKKRQRARKPQTNKSAKSDW